MFIPVLDKLWIGKRELPFEIFLYYGIFLAGSMTVTYPEGCITNSV